MKLADIFRKHESDYRAAVAKEQRLVQMRYSITLEDLRLKIKN